MSAFTIERVERLKKRAEEQGDHEFVALCEAFADLIQPAIKITIDPVAQPSPFNSALVMKLPTGVVFNMKEAAAYIGSMDDAHRAFAPGRPWLNELLASIRTAAARGDSLESIRDTFKTGDSAWLAALLKMNDADASITLARHYEELWEIWLGKRTEQQQPAVEKEDQ